MSGLFVLSWIDVRTLRLPDALTLPLIALGLVYNLAASGWSGAALSGLGAGLGYGVIWALQAYWRWRFKREGIGLGDAKLLSAGGAWCGPMALPFILLAASGLGLVVALGGWMFKIPARSDVMGMRLPFGPFLSVGIALVWLVTLFAH